MSTMVTLDEGIVQDGYPDEQLKTLINRSQEQYETQISNHGTGKNWLRDEARWHIWKACDELFAARNHVHNAEYDAALPNFGDALNHMLFAMEICQHVSTDTVEREANK